MRKRIVKIPDDLNPTDEQVAEMRKHLNEFGISPLFINERIEILEPEKKRKKHRLTRKRRSKNYATLSNSFESAKVISGRNRLKHARNLIRGRESWGCSYVLDICSHIYRRHGSGNSGLCLSNKLMRRGLLRHDIQMLSDNYPPTSKDVKVGDEL